MTQDEIRDTWREAANRLQAIAPIDCETMFRRKKETALEQLARKYLRFSRFSLVMGPVTLAMFVNNHIFTSTTMTLIVSLCFLAFFAICSAMDYWLYKGVSQIDCYTMTVKAVSDRALYYKRKHHLFIAILMPLMLSIVALMAYACNFDRYIVVAMIAGAIIGATIGFWQYLDFMSLFRAISED